MRLYTISFDLIDPNGRIMKNVESVNIMAKNCTDCNEVIEQYISETHDKDDGTLTPCEITIICDNVYEPKKR